MDQATPRSSRPRRRESGIRSAVALLAAVASACVSAGPGGALAPADLAAIHAVDSAFVAAWLRDDTVAVLHLLHPDAVLLPPGSRPVAGRDAIRAFWWPTDGSHTRITSFTRTADDIGGSGTVAWLRGAAALAWEYQKDGTRSSQSSRSIDLAILTRDSTGRWLIARQMWSPIPP